MDRKNKAYLLLLIIIANISLPSYEVKATPPKNNTANTSSSGYGTKIAPAKSDLVIGGIWWSEMQKSGIISQKDLAELEKDKETILKNYYEEIRQSQENIDGNQLKQFLNSSLEEQKKLLLNPPIIGDDMVFLPIYTFSYCLALEENYKKSPSEELFNAIALCRLLVWSELYFDILNLDELPEIQSRNIGFTKRKAIQLYFKKHIDKLIEQVKLELLTPFKYCKKVQMQNKVKQLLCHLHKVFHSASNTSSSGLSKKACAQPDV